MAGRTSPPHLAVWACLFEAMLVPLAVLLSWPLGLDPWQGFEVSLDALALGGLATGLLLILLGFSAGGRARWNIDLQARVNELLQQLFPDGPTWAVPALALLAGLGEEVLFRGVIQTALVQGTSPMIGVVLASLLFGVVHWVTFAYFLLATAMGLYLGLLYHLTGNLMVVVLVHSLYDWAAMHYYLRRPRPAGDQPGV